MRDQNQHYLTVRNLIFNKAHSFSRTTGHDVDELVAQGNLIYCQTLLKHDSKKAKFISLLYLCLNQGLIEYTGKLSKQIPGREELNESEIDASPPIQDRTYNIRNRLNKASTEVKETANILLNKPHKIFGRRALKPKQMYSAIRWHLRDVKKCSWQKTKNTLNELRNLAYNN